MQDSHERFFSENTWLLSKRSPQSESVDLDNELLGLNENPSPRKLKSSLSFLDVYSMVITILLNCIFINHEIMQIGSLVSALVLFSIAGVVTCCCVAVYIELSTFLPSAGGDYEYIRVAFGNMSGFTYAWMMYIFLQACTTAMQALTFSTHISCKLFPELKEKENSPCIPAHGKSINSIRIKGIAIAGILLSTWLNCNSIKFVSRVQNLLALIKGAMVVFILAISLSYAVEHSEIVKENSKPDWNKTNIQQMNVIVTSLLWSVNGFNSVVCLSEEVLNPRKNMRGGLFYGMLSVLFAYGALIVSYFCVLDPKNLDTKMGIAAQVVTVTMGKHWEFVFTIFISISTLACLNGGIATGGRWLYAVARNNQMPSFVARLGRKTHAPYAAVLMQGLWPCICLLFKGPSFDDLLAFFGQNSWYFYAMVGCAYLQFQWTLHSQIWTRKRVLTSACAVVVVLASLIMTAISLYDSPFMTIFSFCFMLSSIPVYHLMEYFKYRTFDA